MFIICLRIRELEEDCARAASSGIISFKFKESYPSTQRNGFTPNANAITAHIGEQIFIKIPIYNQLLNTLQLTDIEVYIY